MRGYFGERCVGLADVAYGTLQLRQPQEASRI